MYLSPIYPAYNKRPSKPLQRTTYINDLHAIFRIDIQRVRINANLKFRYSGKTFKLKQGCPASVKVRRCP